MNFNYHIQECDRDIHVGRGNIYTVNKGKKMDLFL
jgi:hypothetical protein